MLSLGNLAKCIRKCPAGISGAWSAGATCAVTAGVAVGLAPDSGVAGLAVSAGLVLSVGLVVSAGLVPSVGLVLPAGLAAFAESVASLTWAPSAVWLPASDGFLLSAWPAEVSCSAGLPLSACPASA